MWDLSVDVDLGKEREVLDACVVVLIFNFNEVEELLLGRSKNKKNGNQEIAGYEVVRLNIRDIDKDNAKFSMTTSKLNNEKITMRSSEVVRIVTKFNPENLKTDGSKYAFIKDLIILKIGKSYSKYYEYLCEKREKDADKGVFTLEIVEIDEQGNKKVLDTIRYKRLLCGSSFVRNSKELYIKEDMYDAVMDVLLTGIIKDVLFPADKVAKYSTYLGLAATDSKPVSMPNICVVKDFHKKVKDAFDIVEKTKIGDNDFKYKVINYADTKEETEEDINCFDGAGIVSYERAVIWAKELGLDYVPSSFQIRVLNGIKGNLYTFPVTEFIEYLEQNGLEEHLEVKDLWNTLVNIKEQKIDVFLTESQFKFHNMYGSFEEWKKCFDETVEYNGYKYSRTFNIADVSVDVRKLKDELWSAYQPLQTLDFTDDEIVELAEPTVSMAKLLYTDMDEFIKYRGLSVMSDEEGLCGENRKTDDNHLTPWYYKALTLDDSLQYDPYIRKKIESDLENLQRRIFMGKILLNGNYQTAMPDLLALMEHIFGLEVVGALNKGEIYSNYWNNKKVDKVSIWRNPHIACEWFNAKVVQNEKTERWFKYQETGIVTDIYGTIALRLGTMDFDGDTVASVNSEIIYNAIERADIHTIRVVEKDETKNVESNKSEEKKEFRINDFDKIMYTNKLGFSNNIGDVTNKVTVLWGAYGDAKDDKEKNQINDYIKIMSVINQLIIDFVKTGIKVPIPQEILDVVSKSKKPAFMQNKKGRWVDDKKVLANAQKFGYLLKEAAEEKGIEQDEFVNSQKKYNLTNGTVDRLYCHLLEKLSEIQLNFNSTTEECQFTKLLNDIPYTYNATYPKIREKMETLQKTHNTICGKKYYDEKEISNINDSTWRFERFYSYCEVELENICKDRKKLLNYLIYLFYTDDKFYNSDKSILWNVFGEDICNRYMHKEICTSEKVKDNLHNKEQKAKLKSEQIRKMCSEANVICIKELPKEEIVITDTEINYIMDTLEGDEVSQRLMIALLAIYRKINADHTKGLPKTIKVKKGKKNEITMNQICKLADIYYNQVYGRLEKLSDIGMIEIDISNMKVPKITVCIPQQEMKYEEYRIADINDAYTKVIERKFA